MPEPRKWGIFFEFYCIFINEGKCPIVEKMPFFPRKVLKMPGWQHWSCRMCGASNRRVESTIAEITKMKKCGGWWY